MSQQPLTISALNKYIGRKFTADPHLQRVTVIGEVSNYRHRPGGHQYFTLKDEHSELSVVMFSRDFQRVPFEFQEGTQLIATGDVGVYEKTGKYQLVIRELRLDGEGALYAQLQQLKEKLHKEGLFDLRQRPLPRYPKKIAVLTSPTGAVIHDILATIERRYPLVDVTVFPIAVQGKECVPTTVRAFGQVEVYADEYDLVILARGGGSIEDLWGFNDEKVAQAILNCSLPVVSSIGHETDTTIADLVSDCRAATPTGAAELATEPTLIEIQNDLVQFQQRIYGAMTNRLNQAKQYVERYCQAPVLRYPHRLYEPYQQQWDHLSQRLNNYQRQYFNAQTQQLNYLNDRLMKTQLDRKIQVTSQNVQQMTRSLQQAMQYFLQHQNQKLTSEVQLLDANSPLANFQRGYALVEHEGQTVRSIDDVVPSDQLQVQLKDGYLTAEVIEAHAEDLSLEKEN